MPCRATGTRATQDYKILLADQIHKHFFNGGAMTGPALVERLQRRVDEARLSYIAEVARWGTHNGQTNRNPAQWQAYQDSLLNGTLKNLAETQLAKYRSAGMYPDVIAPVLSQHGGSIPAGAGITMSTGATAIYYTLDGSDPRQPGGAIDPAATRAPFEGDVPEPQDFIITGDNWRFLDDGSDRGSAWRSSSFDDSTWPVAHRRWATTKTIRPPPSATSMPPQISVACSATRPPTSAARSLSRRPPRSLSSISI